MNVVILIVNCVSWLVLLAMFLEARPTRIRVDSGNDNKNKNAVRAPWLWPNVASNGDTGTLQPNEGSNENADSSRPDCQLSQLERDYICSPSSSASTVFLRAPLHADFNISELEDKLPGIANYAQGKMEKVPGPTGAADCAVKIPFMGTTLLILAFGAQLLPIATASFSYLSYRRIDLIREPGVPGAVVEGKTIGPVTFPDCPHDKWIFAGFVFDMEKSEFIFYCDDSFTVNPITGAFAMDMLNGILTTGPALVPPGAQTVEYLSCLSVHARALSREEIAAEKELCRFRYYNNCTCP